MTSYRCLDDVNREYVITNPKTPVTNDRIDECEPYVFPQNILGDEHSKFGLARNARLTGTTRSVEKSKTVVPLMVWLNVFFCLEEVRREGHPAVY